MTIMKKIILFSALAIAITAASCSKDDDVTIPPYNNTADTVYMKGGVYAPNSVQINSGKAVMWVNDDNTEHTVTADNGTFSSGIMPAGSVYVVTFNNPDTITYHCQVHPSMKGTVIVLPSR